MAKKSTLSDHMKQIMPAVHAAVSSAVKTAPGGGTRAQPAGLGPGPVVNPKFVIVTVGFEVDDSSGDGSKSKKK